MKTKGLKRYNNKDDDYKTHTQIKKWRNILHQPLFDESRQRGRVGGLFNFCTHTWLDDEPWFAMLKQEMLTDSKNKLQHIFAKMWQ